jgi:hypothetical protein
MQIFFGMSSTVAANLGENYENKKYVWSFHLQTDKKVKFFVISFANSEKLRKMAKKRNPLTAKLWTKI